MITVRSPLPSHLEFARRQMERYLQRMTAIEAKVETERKRRLDERRAFEAAEAVEREAEKARRQAELEAEAADPIYWRLSNVRCLCVRGYVALARDVLDARRGPHSRRSPCQSRGAHQGVPHGGDAEEGGMKSLIPAAEFAEQVLI